MKLRLSALQFNPVLGKPAQNIDKANSLLSEFGHQSISSLLVLPELAFTGYHFNSREEISPFCESRQGISVQWALETAKKTNSHVIVGFPEKTPENIIYNTAVFLSPEGVLGFYRKTHLYSQDKEWGCSIGDGFEHTFGPFASFPWKLQIGICMDLNPYEFTAPFTDFEFMRSLVANKAQLAAILMAWEASEPIPEPGTVATRTVEYLKVRQHYPIPTVFANRCGIERSSVYAGSSTISTNFHSFKSLTFDEEGILSTIVDM